MIYSMTGYGRSEFTIEDKNYVLEVKSLNGKNIDINLKIPAFIKSIENDIRKVIQQNLFRGTIDCQIQIISGNALRPVSINSDLAKYYYQNISTLSDELSLDKSNILQVLLNLPDVITSANLELSDEEKEGILTHTQKACEALYEYRKTEGEALKNELSTRITNIQSRIPNLEIHEKNRIIKIRERMLKQLQDLKDDVSYDENRFEQEMIYYLEKLDVSEEKQRLTEHCRLFIENLSNDNREGIGKKLNFILQEIGREINTLGSKANDSEMQKIVIEMKDELEKAKEQSLNVL